MHTLNCNGKLVALDKPLVMGILNITPDSFYDGGRYQAEASLLKKVQKMLEQGAHIIDVGAVSTRPGSSSLTEAQELERLTPALNAICRDFPEAILSVDTFRSNVARIAVEEYNVAMVNDISAGEMDSKMFETIAHLNVPYVMMHMKGKPKNMQQNPNYANLFKEMAQYFATKIRQLRMHGVKDVVIDPGFGFGKTLEHNYWILKNLKLFHIFDLPLLVGISRKSMVHKLLDATPEGAMAGSLAATTLALEHGAHIVRAHDVKETCDVIKVFNMYKSVSL